MLGEELRLGPNAQNSALQPASPLKAWRPKLLKRAILDFLPAQICLIPKAVFHVWGKTNPQMMMAAESSTCFKMQGTYCNIPARTHSFLLHQDPTGKYKDELL